MVTRKKGERILKCKSIKRIATYNLRKDKKSAHEEKRFHSKNFVGRIQVNIFFIDVVDAWAKNVAMTMKMSVKREKVSSQYLSCSSFLNKSQIL